MSAIKGLLADSEAYMFSQAVSCGYAGDRAALAHSAGIAFVLLPAALQCEQADRESQQLLSISGLKQPQCAPKPPVMSMTEAAPLPQFIWLLRRLPSARKPATPAPAGSAHDSKAEKPHEEAAAHAPVPRGKEATVAAHETPCVTPHHKVAHQVRGACCYC